jgi:hypothetical protein
METASPRWEANDYFSRHQISCFKATEGLHPLIYRAVLSQQYSVANFATLRVPSYLHSPELHFSCSNVVQFCRDLEACNFVTAVIASWAMAHIIRIYQYRSRHFSVPCMLYAQRHMTCDYMPCGVCTVDCVCPKKCEVCNKNLQPCLAGWFKHCRKRAAHFVWRFVHPLIWFGRVCSCAVFKTKGGSSFRFVSICLVFAICSPRETGRVPSDRQPSPGFRRGRTDSFNFNVKVEQTVWRQLSDASALFSCAMHRCFLFISVYPVSVLRPFHPA